MTKEEAKKYLPIIKAFAEGKAIEYRKDSVMSDWTEMEEFPDLAFRIYEFRIKPKFKYRPFKNVKECFREIQRHSPLGWLKRKDEVHFSLMTGIDDDKHGPGISINGRVGWTFHSIFCKYTFADGTPFGIKKEKV